MFRRFVFMLIFVTSVGLLVSTVWLGKDSIAMQRLFSFQFVDNYSERCDANIQDTITERLIPEATKVLALRNIHKPAYFFIETSCSGNVNARQACAVESAAKLHPEADVYLLLLSPPPSLNITSSQPLTILTTHYSNIHILYVHLYEYFRNSPLEDWYDSGMLRASQYQQSHTSDVFRYFTLWKYGGTYLDLDIVLTKSLKNLKNFAGAESLEDIAAGAINFEPRNSYLSTLCLNEIKYNFRGDDWGSNGPGVITRVMKKVCKTENTSKMIRKRCLDFKVLPPNAFYPISWKEWQLYFDENKSNATMLSLKNSYAIHVWNKFSSSEYVKVGSKQPYGLVAQQFCPRIYSKSGNVF